jgi:aminopeptidase N
LTYCVHHDHIRRLDGAVPTPSAPVEEERPSFALPGDQPHYAPDRPADVRHVHLDVALDFDRKAVAGSVTTTFSALFDQVHEVTFDAAELEIEQVTLAGAKPPLEHWTEGEHLHVRLDRPYAYGEEFRIFVRYYARPRSGLHFVGPDEGSPDRPVQAWTQGQPQSHHYWFPCHDFPNDRATTSLHATVPAGFFVLSNGRLEGVDEHRKRGTKTYRWRHDVPHPAYLVTLVVGEFAELRDSWRDIPVNYYVRPGREADAHIMFDKTPAMMEFFSERFGVDYPYEKYAQIVPELFTGAMENTSATTHSFRLLPDKRASLDWKPDPVVAHELAHQWYGDLLTCRDWANIWLNESFATFAEMAWKQHDEGEDEFRVEVRANLRAYLEADKRGRRPIVYNVYYKDGFELFDPHVYEKGSLVLNLLRFLLGEEPFWRAIQTYTRRNRGREVITADLERAIEEATGRSVARFFEEWVYGAGHPELRVTYSWDDEQRMARIGVSQKQAREGKGTVFHAPVEVAFAVPTEETARADDVKAPVEVVRFRVSLEEAEQSFYFPLTCRPLMVRFDPGSRVPKTLEFERPADLLRFQLRRDEDVLGRIEAAGALGKLADPRSIDALEQALLDEPFWAVRVAIAEALGRQRSERGLNALLAGLGEVREPKARRAIAAALGAFRLPEHPDLAERAAEALSDLLERGEPSYFVEEAAATALGKTRTPRAFDRLIATLDRPSWNETIRAGVFRGLGELAEPRVVPVIAQWMLDRGQPISVRQAAAAGLRTLAATRRLPPGEAHTVAVEAAIAALSDPWQYVQYAALDALEDFGDERAIPAVQGLAERALDTWVVRSARETLAALRRGRSRDEAARRLRSDLDELREESRKLREQIAALDARLAAPGVNGHVAGANHTSELANGARSGRPRARRYTRSTVTTERARGK